MFETVQSNGIMTQNRVFKTVLSNGLTVLICQKKAAPKVAVQIWYNVGSVHEKPGEKGMAHFLEHMIFKGTKDKLSESDINAVSQKLSAYANAFTSFDYTAYVFDVPVANWHQVLPIFADCMRNCTFEQDRMNSEVKAVIQELKMYKDEYNWSLYEAMITNLFESHPYHYPIIGYKQDLWNLQRETFLKFYKKYYVPNNATLVIVGDVDIEQTVQQVKAEFDAIEQGAPVEHEQFFCSEDLQAKSVTLYRNTQQAFCALAYLVPGAREKKDFMYDIIGTLLANGKGSRLYRKLVDELGFVTSINCMTYDLFDKGVFFIQFKPRQESEIEAIKEIILREIELLAYGEISDIELRRALKFAQVDYQHLLEDTHKQASAVGKSFICHKDEMYPFEYCTYNPSTIKQDIQSLLQTYFKATLCNQGQILSVKEQDKNYLNYLQEQSDTLDTQILQNKERATMVEGARYAQTIEVKNLEHIYNPDSDAFVLSNGLNVVICPNDDVDMVEILVRYKTDEQYDPKDKLGLSNMVAALMKEGTSTYPDLAFMSEAESYGISISTGAGFIKLSMLSSEIQKGLSLLHDMLENATLDQSALDRVRDRLETVLVQYWDTPSKCIRQIAEQEVYQDHPYAHMALGSEKSLQNLTRDMCYDWYKKTVSAHDAYILISGTFDKNNIKRDVERLFSSWRNDVVRDIEYPALHEIQPRVVDVVKQRDQVVLAFAGLSVDRLHPDYYALLVFEQLLAVGMNSRLFELREQTGLFYTVGGSLVANSSKQPGMIYIRTIVSKDRLGEAERVIRHCLDTAILTVHEDEFKEAQEMVINGFAECFENNEAILNTLCFLKKFNLPDDYFQQSIAKVRAIKLEDMKVVVQKYVQSNKLITIRVGRL